MEACTDNVILFSDGLALIYHEARNVRFLVRGGYIPSSKYEAFVNLQENRYEAWKEINEYRQIAAKESTVARVVNVYTEQFHQSPEELVELFRDPHWKHAEHYGGHAWVIVSEAVCELSSAIEQGKPAPIEDAIHSLLIARHNKGFVHKKLLDQDAEIGVQSHRSWHLAANRISTCR